MGLDSTSFIRGQRRQLRNRVPLYVPLCYMNEGGSIFTEQMPSGTTVPRKGVTAGVTNPGGIWHTGLGKISEDMRISRRRKSSDEATLSKRILRDGEKGGSSSVDSKLEAVSFRGDPENLGVHGAQCLDKTESSGWRCNSLRVGYRLPGW